MVGGLAISVRAEVRFTRDVDIVVLVADDSEAESLTFLLSVQLMPFDDVAAHSYGVIRAALETAGQSIGPNDTLIAAIALANGLTVVTHNTRELRRVPGLLVEDWET